MRVAIADDSVLIREGLARLLPEAGIAVIAQAADGDELLALIGADPPDVALIDIRMPPTHTDEGLQLAAQLRQIYPDMGILVLSQHLSSAYAFRLLGDGARGVGYLLKGRVAHVEEISDAIRRVAAGETVVDSEVVVRLLNRRRQKNPLERLTDRERQVLALIAEGRSNKAIREALVLSPKTVATHVNNIFTKLDLPPAAQDHRRVLAVLHHLRSSED